MANKNNKDKEPLAENESLLNGERVRFEGLVVGLRKNHNGLSEKIRQQSDELKFKNGQLKNGAAKQQRSQEHILILTKAMDEAVDGIFIIDAQKPDFPVIYANQSFQIMSVSAEDEIVGRKYFSLYGAGFSPRVVEEINHTLLQGKSFYGELSNIQKNGEKHWILLRLTPVHDSAGVLLHYIGIQTDVTAMKMLDQEIKEQHEELLHVTRVGKLAEFVSSLAHEISQPLTSILLYAQAAQRMLDGKNPQFNEILQHIVNDDMRASEVIRRMRSLLKKSVPEFVSLDINALVNETIVLIATDVSVRNKTLRTELDMGLSLVRADRIQLQQVLLNLISNSLDAMEGNKAAHNLLVRTSSLDLDTILVEVTDSGCGIAPENIPKLFSHFYTSKPDGLGMGLSISRSIVEAHGGSLMFRNNPEGGATFYFTIPALSALPVESPETGDVL